MKWKTEISVIEENDIRQVAERIGRASRARRVILFGSYAAGNPDEDSDVDLLVIADDPLPPHKRARALYRLFDPYPFPMDLLVYTPDEVEEEKRKSSSFISRVLSEGKDLYVG